MTLPLVPWPRSVVAPGGEGFTLSDATRVVAPGAAAATGEVLARVLRASTGLALPVVGTTDDDGAHLVLAVGPDHAVPGHEDDPEAYTLHAGPHGVRITAAAAAGAAHATQTLRQLLPPLVELDGVTTGPWTVPAVEILDAPRLAYRGVMLDVARSFLTVPEVRAVIDALVAFKANHLHLHLTDDQGWRIEISNEGRADGDDIDYTLLTARSGATAMTECGYRDEPGRTGFYTQADYAEIVAYAAARHVVVVPEIDLPGHTQAALHAIPQLNTAGAAPAPEGRTGRAPAHGGPQVGHSTLDPRSEVTFTFLRHVLTQLAALTPGPYLHVGGDESHATGAEDYAEVMGRVLALVTELGKRPVAWNECARAELRPGDVVQFWNGDSTGPVELVAERVAAGARLLASPARRAYLDMVYDESTPIGLSWTGQHDNDVDVYYDWDPLDTVPGVREDQLEGVEAPLWSETVRGLDQALHLVLPRAAATLEIGWTLPEHRDVGGFLARLGALGSRFVLAGHNFFPSPRVTWTPAVGGRDAEAEEGRTAVLAVVGAVDPAVLGASVDLGDGPRPAAVVPTRPGERLRVPGPCHVVLDDAPAPGSYAGTVTVTWPGGSASAPVALRVR